MYAVFVVALFIKLTLTVYIIYRGVVTVTSTALYPLQGSIGPTVYWTFSPFIYVLVFPAFEFYFVNGAFRLS